jgi:hypothetical protein
MNSASGKSCKLLVTNIDAGELWAQDADYKEGEQFSWRVTQSTAVDINATSLDQNVLYNFAYKVDSKSVNTPPTLAEIALWEVVGKSVVLKKSLEIWDSTNTAYGTSGTEFSLGSDGKVYQAQLALVPVNTDPIADDGTNWAIARPEKIIKDSLEIWDATSTLYGTSGTNFALGSDGKVYKSVLATIPVNIDPIADDGTNWVLARPDGTIQPALELWDATNVNYGTSATKFVLGSDGKVYQSVLATIGLNLDPIADDGTNWILARPDGIESLQIWDATNTSYGTTGTGFALGSDGKVYKAKLISIPINTDPTVDDGTNWETTPVIIDDDTFATATSANLPSAESTKAYTDRRDAFLSSLQWRSQDSGTLAFKTGKQFSYSGGTFTKWENSDSQVYVVAAQDPVLFHKIDGQGNLIGPPSADIDNLQYDPNNLGVLASAENFDIADGNDSTAQQIFLDPLTATFYIQYGSNVYPTKTKALTDWETVETRHTSMVLNARLFTVVVDENGVNLTASNSQIVNTFNKNENITPLLIDAWSSDIDQNHDTYGSTSMRQIVTLLKATRDWHDSSTGVLDFNNIQNVPASVHGFDASATLSSAPPGGAVGGLTGFNVFSGDSNNGAVFSFISSGQQISVGLWYRMINAGVWGDWSRFDEDSWKDTSNPYQASSGARVRIGDGHNVNLTNIGLGNGAAIRIVPKTDWSNIPTITATDPLWSVSAQPTTTSQEVVYLPDAIAKVFEAKLVNEPVPYEPESFYTADGVREAKNNEKIRLPDNIVVNLPDPAKDGDSITFAPWNSPSDWTTNTGSWNGGAATVGAGQSNINATTDLLTLIYDVANINWRISIGGDAYTPPQTTTKTLAELLALNPANFSLGSQISVTGETINNGIYLAVADTAVETIAVRWEKQ